MTKKPRENRVPIMMSGDEVEAIDNWRFANRVATRSDAVRRLAQIGIRFDEVSGGIGKTGWEMVAITNTFEAALLKEDVPLEVRDLFRDLALKIYDLMDAVAYVDLMQFHLKEQNLALEEALKRVQATFDAYREDGTI